jgi:hypothetical protein
MHACQSSLLEEIWDNLLMSSACRIGMLGIYAVRNGTRALGAQSKRWIRGTSGAFPHHCDTSNPVYFFSNPKGSDLTLPYLLGYTEGFTKG